MAQMSDGTYWCDGKTWIGGPCNRFVKHKVSWRVNPSGLPNLSKEVVLDACAIHINQLLSYVYEELVLSSVTVTQREKSDKS